MKKQQQADIAYTMFIHKLSQNFDKAATLSGRALHKSVPCFMGSEKHLEQIIKLANEYAIRLVEIASKEKL